MFGSKPASQVMRAPTPAPSAPPPVRTGIHTIAAGHMIDHEHAPSCWCGPTQDATDARIWHHYGENQEHYPSWQKHPETGEHLVDADGELMPTKRMVCRCCGELMPQGRHHVNADCLACVSKPAKG